MGQVHLWAVLQSQSLVWDLPVLPRGQFCSATGQSDRVKVGGGREGTQSTDAAAVPAQAVLKSMLAGAGLSWEQLYPWVHLVPVCVRAPSAYRMGGIL